MNILVINCYTKVFLGIADGITSDVNIYGSSAGKAFIFENFFKHRKLKQVFRYGEPNIDEEKFVADVISIINQKNITFVFVVGDNYTNIVSKNKKIIENSSKAVLFLDSHERLISLTDKWEMFKLCKEFGISTPETLLFSHYSEILQIIDSSVLTFPVSIKPKIATGSSGYLKVSSNDNLELYKPRIIKLLKEHGSLIIQEHVEGELHDVVFCAREGQLLSALTQKRLLCLYDFGGGGIINQTTNEPMLVKYAEKLLAKVPYSGVANFDFIRKPDGAFVLLECNTRFWGTTQLTIAAGLNMPQQIIDFWGLGKSVPPVHEYEYGLVYKWFFPECIYHIFSKPFSLKVFFRRLKNVLKNYPGGNNISNLNYQNLKYLLGCTINRLLNGK